VLLGTGAYRPVVASRSDVYNPYQHLQSRLQVHRVIKGGENVVRDGMIVKEVPGRELVRRG
jgi:formylmethanofuran dehydrogenase subunit A